MRPQIIDNTYWSLEVGWLGLRIGHVLVTRMTESSAANGDEK
jgi:hypothetical protein